MPLDTYVPEIPVTYAVAVELLLSQSGAVSPVGDVGTVVAYAIVKVCPSMVTTQLVCDQLMVFELVLDIVMLQVSVVPVDVDVAPIATVGVELVLEVKNPPRAKYSVLASITVIATSRIVAIIGETASSFCITGLNP